MINAYRRAKNFRARKAKQNPPQLNRDQWGKEGFLLEMSPDRYLLGQGPFRTSMEPNEGEWSLFHPPFFFFPPFHKNPAPYWYIPAVTGLFSKKQLLAFLTQREQNGPAEPLWEKPRFDSFQKVFCKIQEQIKQNKIQKAVPVFFETADFSLQEGKILSFIYRLIAGSRGQEGVNYAFVSGDSALIGRTPEYLFQKKGLYVQTMALAGTAQSPRHNLLKDPKEKWEHELVAKELSKLLKPLGKVRRTGAYVYSIGNLRHLRTDFKLKLEKQNIVKPAVRDVKSEKLLKQQLFAGEDLRIKGVGKRTLLKQQLFAGEELNSGILNQSGRNKELSFKELCFLLHPTPALGGFPRPPALKLLFELQEKTGPRLFFGAPFGVVKNDKAFCVTAIRNIQFKGGKAYIGSGCGLVKAGRVDREWKELSKKRQAIKDLLF